jgi:multiple sugar transport system substrate-binding protein
VPSFSFVDWMYYRKDWFDQAGIAVPTTLAEMPDVEGWDIEPKR